MRLKFSVPLVCTFVFFAAVFFLHTSPIEDGDFFWHLSSGQWIWEHKSLPTSDPFSYTAKDINPYRPESKRIPFLLRQYWMGQLALYGVWEAAGSAGIVLLRALTYTGILAFLFSWMRRYSAGVIPLVFVFLAGNHLVEHPSERPQLFTFLFMPLLLFLLETLRKKKNVFSGKTFLLLPLLMVLWANTHGGFLLGVGLIIICLFSHLAEVLLKREQINKGLIALLVFSAAVTMINPNGFLTLTEYLRTESYYTRTILENHSPIDAALQDKKFFMFYWAFFFIALTTIVLRIRKIELFHFAIIVVLGVFSLTGIRHIPFFLMAAPLLVGYIAEPPRLERWKWTAAALSLIAWIFATDWSSRFEFKTSPSFPKDAVNFIRTTHPPARMFNYYDWGGYLMHYLPEYKVFIDGRVLIEETIQLFEKVLFTDEWKDVFDFYNVKTVLMPSTGDHYPLLDKLAADPDWQMTYEDGVAVVFVRRGAGN